tara:strand:+ start:436 stop:762 length:327 start_codon:yes stop_codon:yes gene_type:complete
MPSSSKKQHNFMAAVAHNPAFAKKAGVPQSVGKDFSSADQGRKFAKGGDMKHEDVKMDKKMMQKAVNKHEGRLHKGSAMTKLAKGGGIESKGKTKGKMITMKSGGKAC